MKRNLILAVAIAATMGVSSAAFAQVPPPAGNYSDVLQDGDQIANVTQTLGDSLSRNNSDIDQVGGTTGATADVTQVGFTSTLATLNDSSITQNGAGADDAIVRQQGSGTESTSTITQTSTGSGTPSTGTGRGSGTITGANQATVNQNDDGTGASSSVFSDNESIITQNGDNNVAVVNQTGDGNTNDSSITQTGDLNDALVSQAGETNMNTSTVTQTGNGNIATVEQGLDISSIGVSNNSIISQAGGSTVTVIQN